MMQPRSKPMGMALGKAMQDALNEQITREFYASNLYLSMSAYCDNLSLLGFAHWLRLQADEERQHGLKIYDHIMERNGQVQIGTVDSPPANFPSVLGVFQQALEHEQLVSSHFQQLYRQALDAQDFTTQTFLEWFLTEQVEEEKTATEVVDWLTMIGDKQDALVLLDREMAQRQPEPTP
ncbi:ferritin [Nitrolancea hollandica]|uniref:Ferritin n=1 Tax=Nitrolancea hollandica Lb TaxID=1129897 RepID=I4EEC8_9BACT|nr:ferritin [Nitrolancea hollandica]CCF83040.1 Ferritin [Nitrolancea hollandica Lb]